VVVRERRKKKARASRTRELLRSSRNRSSFAPFFGAENPFAIGALSLRMCIPRDMDFPSCLTVTLTVIVALTGRACSRRLAVVSVRDTAPARQTTTTTQQPSSSPSCSSRTYRCGGGRTTPLCLFSSFSSLVLAPGSHSYPLALAWREVWRTMTSSQAWEGLSCGTSSRTSRWTTTNPTG
jgi:hypothetical protein